MLLGVKELFGRSTGFMAEIEISPAAASDCCDIAAIRRLAQREAYCRALPPEALNSLEEREQHKDWAKVLRSEEVVTAARRSGALMGFAHYGRSRDNDLDPAVVGELFGIYVHPDWWRKGIGMKLLNTVLGWCAHSGLTQLALWVFESNAGACRFYEARGFVFDGKREPEGGLAAQGLFLFGRRYRLRLPVR
jgi:GNAT superfamily N-acetyltransferase